MGLLDSGIGEGLNQASGTILQTGMNLMKFKQDKLMQEQKLQIEQDHVSRANKLLDMQIAEKQKLEELVPIEETLSKFGFKSPEEHQLFISKVPLDIEQIGGVNYIPRGKGIVALQKHSSDPEFNIQLGEIRTSNFNKTITEIDNQLGSPDSKLKPEQVQQLQKQRAALVTQRTQTANAMKIEQLKLKNARLINVPQGTDVIDPLNPEKPVYSNPKEAKPPVIKSVDRGNVVDIYTDGVLTSTKPKGKAPASSDSREQKELNSTIAKLDKYTSFYVAQNKELEKKDDDASKERIAYNNTQIEAVAQAKTDVLTGAKSPKDVWVDNKKTTSPQPKGKKDKFGFVLGETKQGYKYIGNDQWQKQ